MVVAFVAMVVVALLAATPAWASSPSDVSLRFDPAGSNHATFDGGYVVSFTSTSFLCCDDTVPSGSITISAPTGTVFHDEGGLVDYLLVGRQRYDIQSTDVVLSDDGSTVTILLSDQDLDIKAGDRVEVHWYDVTNPPEPGQYTLSVSTSSDTTPATSAPYTIVPARVGGPPPVPEGPTSKEQCKKGGYEEFDFKNQGQCVAFVERGPKNKGGEASS
jgi:hypothetical protein